MKNGNYASFLAENEEILQRCRERPGCDMALFNLGFIYGYPRSPYRDPATALWYLDELIKTYPDSPWAFHAQAWISFINEGLVLEESRRQLQSHLYTREARIRELREQLKAARQIDIEMDKKERELLR
jgi:outer membrane protein assembly factor BamD (BamD/ComL family)